jgi:hypothetical protein
MGMLLLGVRFIDGRVAACAVDGEGRRGSDAKGDTEWYRRWTG